MGCLALLPGASAWRTVVPQVLAGAGMGLALPALSGELIPERTREDIARLLTIRHAGIAIALAALAPLISSNLTSTIDTAREQGTAAVLDAQLPPQDKIEIAPDLFGGLNTDDPRGELQKSIAKARAGLDRRAKRPSSTASRRQPRRGRDRRRPLGLPARPSSSPPPSPCSPR